MAELRASRAAETGVLEVLESGGEVQEESVDLRDSVLPLGTAGTAEPDEKAEQSSSWMKIWRGALGFFRSGSMTEKKPGI